MYLGCNVGEDDSIALEPPLGRRHLDIRLSNLPHTNSLSVTFSGEDDSIALEPPLGRRHLDIRLPNLPHTNSLSATLILSSTSMGPQMILKFM